MGSHVDMPVIRCIRMTVCESPMRASAESQIGQLLPRLLQYLHRNKICTNHLIRRFYEANPAGANSNIRKPLHENCTKSQPSLNIQTNFEATSCSTISVQQPAWVQCHLFLLVRRPWLLPLFQVCRDQRVIQLGGVKRSSRSVSRVRR
jgi:hypothetical protein